MSDYVMTAKFVPAPEGESNTAYYPSTILETRDDLVGVVERGRMNKAPAWMRSLVYNLVHRIANLRALLTTEHQRSVDEERKRIAEWLIYIRQYRDGWVEIDKILEVVEARGGKGENENNER